MIYITGDTHRTLDIAKLLSNKYRFKEDDYLIICGDFGGIWYNNEKDQQCLDFYKQLKCTILVVDGNHENFDALYSYPVVEWNGGKIHKINNKIFHLMRGEIFNIEGKKFFTFGGGTSIDKNYRVFRESWWPEENFNYDEMDNAFKNLEKNGYKVNYVLTHAAPVSIVKEYFSKYFVMGTDISRCPTELFLDELFNKIKYEHWFCGHYHLDIDIPEKNFTTLYDKIMKL